MPLPRWVETKLVALTKRLGLRYAAVDLVERPDGLHVFLEINPNGEWGWPDDVVSGAISTNIAHALANKHSPRRTA